MLSPAKIPNLNNASTNFGGFVGGVLDDAYGKLDKRYASSVNPFDSIDVAQAVSESITNAIGINSPYYTIGEVPAESNNWVQRQGDKFGFNTSAWVRAISTWTGAQQDGVIIDCLGEMTGKWNVEFTQNPIFYGTNAATDSRVRKPSSLTAEVYISNYLSDNAINGLISSIEKTTLGTSILSNALLYDGNTRAQQGLYKLIWLMENGRPFTVYTPHGIYESMLIKDISVRTDDKSMEMLNATLTFEEIIMTRPYYSGYKVDNIPGRKILDASKDTKIQAWATIRNAKDINKGL